MPWLLLAIASALIIGTYEVARKAAVTQGPALVVLFSVSLGSLLLLLPVVAFSWLRAGSLEPLGLALHELSPHQHLLVLLKSVLVSSAWGFSYFAIKHLPISVASPLRATTPVVTVSLALLLFGEQPSRFQWLGMFIIFLGHFGFARLGRQEGIHYSKDRWILILGLATFLGSLSGLYDKHLLQQLKLPPTTVQFWFSADNAVLQAPWALWAWSRARRATPSAQADWSFLPSALLAGVLLVLADQLYMRAVAMDGALISVVSLARRSSVLVSFSLGGLLFRERFLKKKLWPLALILTGLTVLLL